jgi:hypothetical protein
VTLNARFVIRLRVTAADSPVTMTISGRLAVESAKVEKNILFK